MNYYLKGLKNYTNFKGRARRKEFWMFSLISFIFAIVAMFIDRALGTCFKMNLGMGQQMLPYGYVYMAYGLFVLLPGLALSVRRLHDVGKSGWFLLIALIPLIGAIWLLVLDCTDGNPGDNQYGPNPKQADLATA